MKVKIQAGAEFDALSPEEFDKRAAELTKGWMTELARGVRFRDFSGQTTLTAGGTWTIGDRVPIGPGPGFVWAVTRVAIYGEGLVLGTDLWSVYKSEVTPVRLVESGLTRGRLFGQTGLVLGAADSLVAAGVGTGTAAGNIYLSGAAIELPVQLAWQLL